MDAVGDARETEIAQKRTNDTDIELDRRGAQIPRAGRRVRS